MDNSVLNTNAETPYRILLLLSEQSGKACSCKRLVNLDFVTIYSGVFGLTDKNLHGDSWMKFTEYVTREPCIREGIRYLVFSGWASVKAEQKGFIYAITPTGQGIVEEFSTSYSRFYRAAAKIVIDHCSTMTDDELSNWIHCVANTAYEGGNL